MTMRYVVAAALAGLAALGAPAADAQFYKGKTVTMMINYPAGGPTDIEGRIIARHLDRHIPGKPTVIIKNVGGGAGNLGANQLGEQSPRDGTTFGFFTWNFIDQILGAEGLRIKYQDFGFIAGVQQPNVVYARKDIPPGIAKPQDILKAKDFKIGALGTTSTQMFFATLPLDILGVKYKVVSGYKGLKEVETAVQQNEVQFSSSSLPGFTASIEPTMVKTGIVMPLFYFDIEDASGNFRKSPALPNIQTFLEVYRSIHGADKMPSGQHWETLRFITRIMNAMFRTAFLPPNAPKEALQDLRAAFANLWKDEQFLADYEKTVRTRPGFVGGEEGERIIASLGTVKPELVKFLRDYSAAVGG
jgi:tripartite-type tricarboxylate transporter receptor subunit TctC